MVVVSFTIRCLANFIKNSMIINEYFVFERLDAVRQTLRLIKWARY